MQVTVQVNDNYEFLIKPDTEAIELIHQICLVRGVKATQVIKEITEGGLCLQEHLFLHQDRSGT